MAAPVAAAARRLAGDSPDVSAATAALARSAASLKATLTPDDVEFYSPVPFRPGERQCQPQEFFAIKFTVTKGAAQDQGTSGCGFECRFIDQFIFAPMQIHREARDVVAASQGGQRLKAITDSDQIIGANLFGKSFYDGDRRILKTARTLGRCIIGADQKIGGYFSHRLGHGPGYLD